MKKLIALILAVLLCLSLFGCQAENDEEPKKTTKKNDKKTEERRESVSTPLLYKVSDDAGNVIWLLGSIHVGMEDYYPLPDYVLDAFDGSDALAVEADIVALEKDLKEQVKAMSVLVYTDGSTIDEHIPAELYEQAVEIIQDNMRYTSAYDSYIPAFWSSLVDNIVIAKLDIDPGLGVDRHLIKRAYKADKAVEEVESVMFQYSVLAGFSEELQIMMLEGSVAGYEDMEAYGQQVQAMMDAWMVGNEEELAALIQAEETFESEEEAALYAEYNDALVTQRNLSMTEYAVEALESGRELFICVGAAHIVGEGAMAELLREMGYTVEVVR